MDYSSLFSRGGDLNSAIPRGSSTAPPVRPLNTSVWGNLSRGGKLASAIPNMATKAPTALGVLGKVATGLKFLTGPIGAGIAVGGKILGAKDAGAGEDDKLRSMGFLPPLPGTMLASHTLGGDITTTPTLEANSVTPIPPLDPQGSAVVDGNRINYGDIGNSLKDTALINSKGYSFGVAPSDTGNGLQGVSQNTGGTGLANLLKTIQSIQPVEDYAHRIGALNTGNTTWDMNGLDKILAAKAGHQADTERFQHQVGALANLGSAQMNAEAAKAGHETTLLGEREKIAAMAPYYASEAEKNKAQAGAALLAAKADVLKALTEQSKENPILKAALETLKGYSDKGDWEGYNDYAKKISILTGKLVPPMRSQD